MIHSTINIIGRVQGVYYRASALNAAQKNNIRGFIQNKDDGSVYIEAEGEEEAMQNFIEWCKIGPPGASVEKVDIKTGDLMNYDDFSIKH